MKNNFTAYLLWFFLGGLGIHAFYCKKTNWGLFSLLTYVLALSLLVFDGGIMFFLHVVNVLFQAFFIPTWVKEANEKEAQVQSDLIAEGIRKARDEDA
jgi:TM2 domain-containing membrane protein YozV